jgi:small membrane protein
MTLIKLLLLVAIAVFGLLALRGSRRAIHKVLWRGYVVVVVVAAALSVLFPDVLTTVAEAVGVGRGADLLLYVLVVTFMLVSVVLFRRLAELERRYTEVARSVALNEAPHTARHEDEVER